MGADKAKEPSNETPKVERQREPPETILRGPHAYRGDQFKNSEYIEWIRKEVLTIEYDTDEGIFVTDAFKELGRGNAEAPEVVLMTQTSPDRLPFVRRMIALWNGPATVALYIPFPKMHPEAAPCVQRSQEYLLKSIEDLAKATDREPALAASIMYSNQESPTVHCSINEETTGLEEGWRDEHMWSQLFENRPYLDIYDAEYPVGSLRQLALDLVPDDSFAFLVDADFVLVKDFARKLQQGESGTLLRYTANAWQEHSERHAVIIPAFQQEPERTEDEGQGHVCASSLQDIKSNSDCWIYNQYEVPLNETALKRMLDAGSVTGFYEDRWPGSHGCYVPSQAIQKEEPFSIAYTHPCEPYIIALKAAMPEFDGRWRGRMLDKTAYITHMASWGFKFHVDPASFMIHLPHASGVALKERPKDDSTDQVFADFWALPYGLTRVFLDDIRDQEEAQCEVLPVVRPLEEEDVVSVMLEDGAEKPWCKDASVEFDWSRIQKDFSAPDACSDGACEGEKDSSNDRSGSRHTGRDTSGATDENGGGDENISDTGKERDLHIPDEPPAYGSIYWRGALNPAQSKATMLWSAAGIGILAWVLFVWFYHSTLNPKKRGRKRFISMQQLETGFSEHTVP